MTAALENLLARDGSQSAAIDWGVIMEPSEKKPEKVLVSCMLGTKGIARRAQAWFPTTLKPRDPAMQEPINNFLATIAAAREIMRLTAQACDEIQALLQDEYSGDVAAVIQAEIACARRVVHGLEVAFDSHLTLLKPFHQAAPTAPEKPCQETGPGPRGLRGVGCNPTRLSEQDASESGLPVNQAIPP